MRPKNKIQKFYLEGKAQGTTYHIAYFGSNSVVSYKQIDSIFLAIDSSLSIYKPYSLINRFNNSDAGVEMDNHLYSIVQQSLDIFKCTEGVSDITVYPIVNIWGFGINHLKALPDSEVIRKALPCVGSDKIFINHNWLIKTKPCVKIDVNGIAQGYTVDVIGHFFEENKIQNYIVELGGEVRVNGRKQPDNELFEMGIESPSSRTGDNASIKKLIHFEKGAVTTSGNYRAFIEKEGKTFSHLMNPKSGYPLQNEMISATVWAKNATIADGYDNAFMGMGITKALAFLKKRNDMEAYFIYHLNNGDVGDTATAGFYKMMEK